MRADSNANIIMVAHNTINNLSFSDSDLSEEPLDFTMSKFKSSTPMKHPLYYQVFGSNSGSSLKRDDKEQGKALRMNIHDRLRSDTNSKQNGARLRDFLNVHLTYKNLIFVYTVLNLV